ncbi:MAG: hypothetical protein ABIT38_21940, partial [Gemmatimonadaceae bacterium]
MKQTQRTLTALALALTPLAFAPRDAVAQQRSSTSATSVSATGGRSALKILDPGDVSFWKNIRSATTSFDGKWFAYVNSPNEGDAEVVVRPTAADGQERRFGIGEPPIPVGFGGSTEATLVISGDAKWVAFTTYPTSAEGKKLKKDKKPLQNGVTLVNLATGERRDFEKVRRFTFAGEHPQWLVTHRYAAEGTNSAEMLLVDLRNGAMSTIGAVADFSLSEDGGWLAWSTETRDLVGSGVQLRNLATDVVRT